MDFSFGWNEKIRRDELLANHSSFKIGGRALYFAEPQTREDLSYLIHFSEKESLPWILIGNASNILFSDQGFQGLVISLKKFELNQLMIEGPYLRVSAGVSLIPLAYYLAAHSLGGLEFVSTIPGTVGGALVMNAGYSRHSGKLNQIADWVEEVVTLDTDGSFKCQKKEDVSFGYRSSSLMGRVVVEATFKLQPAPREEVWRELRANLAYREGVQPLRYPSAGSVFKNPQSVETTAGKLIDHAGLRGFRIGDAQISEKHGNFIINLGRAKAREVLDLIALAQAKVKEKFGIGLELEVKCVPSEMALSF